MANLFSPYFLFGVASTVALVWVQIVKPATIIPVVVGGIALTFYSLALWRWLSEFQHTDVATKRSHERGLKIFGVGLFVLAATLGFLLHRQVFPPTTDESEATLGRSHQSNTIGEPQNDKSSAQLRLEQLHQQQTQPYTIRKADWDEFIRVLSLSGKFSVNIEYSFDNPLAEIFAKELTTLLTLSKWEVNGPEPVFVSEGKLSPGVTISTNKEQEIPLGATLLIDLLRDQEIEVQLLTAPPRKVFPASFDIFVGTKE